MLTALKIAANAVAVVVLSILLSLGTYLGTGLATAIAYAVWVGPVSLGGAVGLVLLWPLVWAIAAIFLTPGNGPQW